MSNVHKAAIAVIAAASVSLSMSSVVQAKGSDAMSTHEKPPVPVAIYSATRHAPAVNRPAPPLDGAFHIDLNWPEGSPDYHGSNGG
jgi:hypothetical protein